MAAAMTGRVENMKFLLQRGARIDYQNNEGRNALMNAAERGLIEVVQELLAAGANTKQTDMHGKTAAQIAEENFRPNCAEEIITFENASLN
jgi:ankyrin repeat protein